MRPPPVRPAEHVLPYAQLDWVQFQEVVRDLLRRRGFQNVQHYGTQGDAQEGIDIRADDPEGRHTGVQVKRERDFPGSAVAAALAAARAYQADRFIIALSRSATVSAIKEIDKHPTWELWDETRLSDEVRALPRESAAEFIRLHFHEAHVEEFLRWEPPRTFVSRERFFAGVDVADRLFTHAWQRAGGAGVTQAIDEFLGDDRLRVLLLTGPIGIGKSKALFDATAPGTRLGGRQHFFTAHGIITPQALAELPPGETCVVVDGVEDVDGLDALLAHVRATPDLKLILTSASASAAEAKDSILAEGFDGSELMEISASRVSREATIALVQQVLGREDPHIEEAVAQYAIDSPLSTILVTRVLRDRTGQDPDLAGGRVRDLVRALYRDVALGRVSDTVPPEDVRALLAVLAALGPARFEGDDWIALLAAALAWDPDRVLRGLDALDDAGVLHRRGELLTVVPEMLRQSILLEACVARNRPTTFARRLWEVVAADHETGLLRNLAIADVESQATGGPTIFAPVWSEVAQSVRAATSLDRAGFLRRLDLVGRLQPHLVYEIVAFIADHPAENDAEQPVPENYRADHEAVLDHVPDILRDVMLGAHDLVPLCLERMWVLGKDDAHRFHGNAPLQMVARLAEYEIGFGTGLAMAIVEAVAGMIARAVPDTATHSLISLIAPVLDRDLNAMIERGTGLQFRPMVIRVDSVRPLRDRALRIVVEATRGPDDRRADAAILALLHLLPDPANQHVEPTAETVASWNREREVAFQAFQEVMTTGTWPLRELRIQTKLLFQSRFGHDSFVRARATELLAAYASTPDRDRSRILVREFMDDFAFLDPALEEYLDAVMAGADRAETFLLDVTAVWVVEQPDPETLLDDLAGRLAAVETAGLAGGPEAFFNALYAVNAVLAQAVAELIVNQRDTRFYRWLGPFIGHRLRADPVAGEAYAERVLDLGDVDAAFSVGFGLVYRNDGADSAARARLYARLLRHDDVRVQRLAANKLMVFAFDNQQLALDVVLTAPSTEDIDLVDALAAATPVDLITESEANVEALFSRFVTPAELGMHTLTLLQRLAARRSGAILRLFEARVGHRPNEWRFHAIPQVGPSIDRLMKDLATSPTFADEVQALFGRYGDFSDPERSRLDVLFGHVSTVAPELAKAMCLEAIESDVPERQLAAAAWVSEVRHDLLTNDLPFLIRFVGRAERLDDPVWSLAKSSVFEGLVKGPSTFAPFEGLPQAARLEDVAAHALEDRSLGERVREFFGGLREDGQAMGQRSRARDEEIFGPQ